MEPSFRYLSPGSEGGMSAPRPFETDPNFGKANNFVKFTTKDGFVNDVYPSEPYVF